MDRVIEEHDFLDVDDVDEFNRFLYQESRTLRDKQRMWLLLDKALKNIMSRPEKTQMEIKKDIRSFLKGYCFLIQATAYRKCYSKSIIAALHQIASYFQQQGQATNKTTSYNGQMHSHIPAKSD